MAEYMVSNDVGAAGLLPFFDLRNGDVTSAVILLSKAAIGTAYKWMPITRMVHEYAGKHMDKYIKVALYQLETNAPANCDAATRKKMAIALGTARATMTAFYRLEPEDLIPGETAKSWLAFEAPSAGHVNGRVAVSAEAPQPFKDQMAATLDLTLEDHGAISDLVLCATGLPAMQGASLMACGHHYLSDVKDKSRAIYDVVERQFWTKEKMKAWVDPVKERMQDCMWHKAAHPINIVLKMKWDVEPSIALKIRKAGAGSGASRLPATEGVLKNAHTAKTLMINVRPFYEHYGGSMDFELITEAINCVEALLPWVSGRGEVVPTVPGVPVNAWRTENVPAFVVDRESANAWLEDILTRNNDITATAFGFYEALVESNVGEMGGKDEQTLLQAYSLVKLRTQCFAAFQMGKEAHADYMAFKAKERAAGPNQGRTY